MRGENMYANIEMSGIVKQIYPAGTKVRLKHMVDIQSIPEGTEGEVMFVDDIGTIHVQWSTGSSLGLLPGTSDSFEILEKDDNAESKKAVYNRWEILNNWFWEKLVTYGIVPECETEEYEAMFDNAHGFWLMGLYEFASEELDAIAERMFRAYTVHAGSK